MNFKKYVLPILASALLFSENATGQGTLQAQQRIENLNPETGKISFNHVGPEQNVVPLATAQNILQKEDLLAKSTTDVTSFQKSSQFFYENAKAGITNILYFALTYQMPKLDAQKLANGSYAGYIIPLPALLEKKKTRIPYNEMKANNLVENPFLVGINDSLGRPWTYTQVINQTQKDCREEKLSNVISRYILKDHGYSFLVITKTGKLSRTEQNEIYKTIKKETATAMDETLTAAEKNIKKTTAYSKEDIKSELDVMCDQAAALHQLIKNKSILFKSGIVLPKSIADEGILNDMPKDISKKRISRGNPISPSKTNQNIHL